MTDPPLTLSAWLRYDAVERILRRLADVGSVLEIGAGQGAFAVRLARRYAYVGVEPDAVSFATARARLGAVGRGRILHGDVTAIEPAATFDLVCAFEVLEHLEDDRAALAQWRGHVRPGGWVLVSVPYKRSRWGAADAAVGHFRRYERAELAGALAEAGFAEPLVHTYGFPLGYLLEAARNGLWALEGARGSREERTAGSGRRHQPPDALAFLTQLATAPFRRAQRPFARTSVGTGLIALARRPA